MPPRSIWNGTVTFGLVNVPIKLYSAIESKTVHFSEVHARDGAKIEHRRICPKEGKEVEYKEIVKGYVGSRDEEDAYRLLHEALKRSGRAGIGRFTYHDREYLVALRALDDAIALHTLRFHDEVVSADDLEIDSGRSKPGKREVEMANRLLETLHEDFEPERYDDSYRESVLELIRQKAAGKEIDLAAQEEPAHGDDLAAALEASLGAGNGGGGRKSKAKAGS